MTGHPELSSLPAYEGTSCSGQSTLHHRIIALNWILEPEPCEPGPPVPLIEDLLTSPEYVHSDTPMVWLQHALSLNPLKELHWQRNNPMWSIVRKYSISASNFGAVLSSKQRRLTLSLKKQLMSAYNLESIKAVAWGITHEDDALRKYEKDFDAAVEQSGYGCMNPECWELHLMA